MIGRSDVFEICEHVAEAQALLDQHASNQISDPGLLAIKLRTLLREDELLSVMHAVGNFPPSMPLIRKLPFPYQFKKTSRPKIGADRICSCRGPGQSPHLPTILITCRGATLCLRELG
jgi:hypothetical protein